MQTQAAVTTHSRCVVPTAPGFRLRSPETPHWSRPSWRKTVAASSQSPAGEYTKVERGTQPASPGWPVAACGGLRGRSCKSDSTEQVTRSQEHAMSHAIADFLSPIRIVPRSAEDFHRCGVVRRAHGDLRGAIADFDRALG